MAASRFWSEATETLGSLAASMTRVEPSAPATLFREALPFFGAHAPPGNIPTAPPPPPAPSPGPSPPAHAAPPRPSPDASAINARVMPTPAAPSPPREAPNETAEPRPPILPPSCEGCGLAHAGAQGSRASYDDATRVHDQELVRGLFTRMLSSVRSWMRG